MSITKKYRFIALALLLAIGTLFLSSVTPALVYAEAPAANAAVTYDFQGSCDSSGGKPLGPSNCSIVAYVVLATNALSALVGIVVVLMIVVGGLQYMAARDDPQAVSAAKTRIRNAVLALVFYLFAFAFLQWLVPGGVI